MRYLRSVAVIVALAAFPAVALASRPATRGQRNGLYKAFKKLNHVHTTPARCLTFRVSTAESGWANVTFNGAHSAHGCLAYGFNGATIYHNVRGQWRFVTEGSSFVGSNGKCSVPHVPLKVARDFKLC